MFVNFGRKAENNEYVVHNPPSVAPVKGSVIYEQPLHERMRLFMRLEVLMHRFWHSLQHDGGPDTHNALLTLIELLNLTNRVDLKRELMKELERQTTNLSRLREDPGVDQRRLQAVIDQQRKLIENIHTISGQLDQQVKGNDFFNSVRQRVSIPGGTCDFDLPAYHFWLMRPVSERRKLLEEWARPFDDIHEAVGLILQLIRNAGAPRELTASKGFFEQTLDTSQPWQIIRIVLPQNAPFYPEISAGRQRFNVRFLQPGDMRERAPQCQEDIRFSLTCCAL
ncbi:cell division protein ZapD [Ectothiorhodospira haloalkaliphila]|uniref:cell division protein ZapD n=1 Tax=Ectothiorhodospira haloalkaliphila TaxID=421628 RepID=UPI001EE94548|nr:cell division protein ZapD [Ectothiorhodospira haloalkaliphila]MCG5523440.1 cell division protein ZapD [Ectothiorhodospira haloalkaliphila]